MRNITIATILLLSIASIWCVIQNKAVLSILSTIFSKLKNDRETNIARRIILNNISGTGSIPYRLFDMCVFYLQIFVPAALLSYVVNQSIKQPDNSNKYCTLSVCIIVLSALVTTDDNRDTICLIVACFLVTYLKYKTYLANKLPILIVFFSIFVVSFLFIKSGILTTEEDRLSNISKTLCSYFSSIPNVSASFEIQYNDKLNIIWGDIISGIPYLVFFFRGNTTSVALFNNVVYGYEGKINLIMPLISYGYCYFGMLAPVLTIATYYIAIEFEKKFNLTEITFNKILYAVIFVNLAIAPCTLGFPSILKRCCFYIPLIILANINEAKRGVNNK